MVKLHIIDDSFRRASICDFCSDPNVAWKCPAHPGVVKIADDLNYRSADWFWGACEDCFAMLVIDDREGLLKRSLYMWIKLYPEEAKEIPIDTVKAWTTKVHDMYFANRLPGAERV